MHTLSKRQLAVLLLTTVIGGFVIVFATGRSPARAESEASRPTAEMTPAAAQNLVVSSFGRENAGFKGELTVTTIRTNYAQANAVLEGEPISAAVYGGPAAIAQWETSPVYVVIMQAASGGLFHPDVSPPRGRIGPTGSVMSVIVNAYTGVEEGLNLETSLPTKLDELGAELRATIPAVGIASAASTSVKRPFGLVIGALSVHGRPTPGWQIVIALDNRSLARTPIAKKETGRDGRFTIRLAAGNYRVAALRPGDGLCGISRVHITVRREAHLTLRCS
jgi:hypothetical protein